MFIHITGCITTSPHPTPNHLSHDSRLQTVLVDGHRIAYQDIGQGSPLVLIHGFGGARWHWEQQLTGLSSNFRVITLDLLGCGRSDKPNIPYSPNTLIESFRGFMDNLGLDHATLVENSLGVGLALGMALRYLKRVDRLILISGFPANISQNLTSDHYEGLINHRPPIWLAKVGNWFGGHWLTKMNLEEIVYNQELLTPSVIERSYQNKQNSDFLPPLFSLLDHLPQWEQGFGLRLKQVHHSTLIIWGSEDRLFPQTVGRSLRQIISDSSFHVIQDAGHIPQ